MEARKSASRGVFVVLEGLDRVGKTSIKNVLARLVTEEKGDGGAYTISFPDRSTPLGQRIDGFLKKRETYGPIEIHNMYGDNRTERMGEIQEALQAGRTVICDRYVYSGCAYTLSNLLSRFQPKSSRADMEAACKEYLKELCVTDINQLIPDLVVHLSTEETAIEKREGFGDEIYETATYMNLVRSLGYPQTYDFYSHAHKEHGTLVQHVTNKTDEESLSFYGEQRPRHLIEVANDILKTIHAVQAHIDSGEIRGLDRYSAFIDIPQHP